MKKLVKLESDKEISFVNIINEFIDPSYIYIPINKLSYKINDYIYKNTYIDNNIASISGKVTEIKKMNYDNKIVDTIKVSNDYTESFINKKEKKKIKNIEELINYLNEFHLDNIINKIKEINNIENIVITSIDEECYSLNEFMILSTYFNEIIDTINYLIPIFSLNKGYIITKNTLSIAIKNVKSILGTYPNIKLYLAPDKYLMSLKENVCSFLNLKIDNTIVFTVEEIYILYNVLLKHKDITDKIITISGNNIVKSLIIKTRIGVCLKEIIDKYIELKDNNYDIYINGIFQGYKIKDYKDVIITNNIHTIIINKKIDENTTECINCGACYKICPVNINVKDCYFNKKISKKCLGCGLCNYICPANLKLKEIVKEGNNEENN